MTTKPTSPELLSTGKACTALGLHPHTLRKYARQGLIEAIRTPGGQYRYNVALFLATQRAKRDEESQP